MPQLSVKVDGRQVTSVARNGQLAISNLSSKYVRAEMEQARDEVKTYPPELPNQRYRRTGRRGEATRLISYPGNNQYSSKYTIESNPRYPGGRTGNPYTIGDALGQGQARIHQGRWKLLYTAAQEAVGRIVARGQTYFQDVFKGGAP